MEQTYLVKIKKEYASDVIEDLLQMEAIEVLEEPAIPEWKKEEVRKRLEDAALFPEKLVAWSLG
jgi:predicted CopG family antitoxin